MSDVDATRVINAYIAIRDKRAEIKKAYEAADAVEKEKLNKLEVWLLKSMDAVGSAQLKANDGVGIAFKQLSVKYACQDWTTYWDFIHENKRYDMLQKRIGEGAVSKYKEEVGEYPPGINSFSEINVVVRRK